MRKEAALTWKIGLMGGTFNPIHNGHIAMARAADSRLRLDKVMFITSARPPHKGRPGASPEERMEMARLALASEKGMEVSGVEMRREGATYTVDTLRELTRTEPAEYVFIIGSDSLLEFGMWRDPEVIAGLCSLAVLRREGTDDCAVHAEVERLSMELPADITLLDDAIPDISSTVIRERVHAGLSLEGLVPDAVAEYIDRRRLYDPPRELTRDERLTALRGMLTADRLEHSLGVEAMAEALARRFGIPVDQAVTAGLLHDCAKCMPLGSMLDEANRLGVRADDARRESAELLHAFVGAALLRERFGVTDPDVIRAVKYHNTGTVSMTDLDLAVYLADKIELGRKPYRGLEEARKLSERDLVGAVRLIMRDTSEYVVSRGRKLHPDTAAALESLSATNNDMLEVKL